MVEDCGHREPTVTVAEVKGVSRFKRSPTTSIFLTEKGSLAYFGPSSTSAMRFSLLLSLALTYVAADVPSGTFTLQTDTTPSTSSPSLQLRAVRRLGLPRLHRGGLQLHHRAWCARHVFTLPVFVLLFVINLMYVGAEGYCLVR